MKFIQAVNISVGCIISSPLENNEKREIVKKLRQIDQIVELVEYREYGDDEIVNMIEKIVIN